MSRAVTIYPAPMRCKGLLPKWRRLKLDAMIARRHGLQIGHAESKMRRH
jgi:hypothetical protein